MMILNKRKMHFYGAWERILALVQRRIQRQLTIPARTTTTITTIHGLITKTAAKVAERQHRPICSTMIINIKKDQAVEKKIKSAFLYKIPLLCAPLHQIITFRFAFLETKNLV